jgi:hypothetical protein
MESFGAHSRKDISICQIELLICSFFRLNLTPGCRDDGDPGRAGDQAMTDTLHHDILDHSDLVATRTTTGAMPSGWWVMPGVVAGLGLWALIGFGLHAALTGGDEGAAMVTMAAPLDDAIPAMN